METFGYHVDSVKVPVRSTNTSKRYGFPSRERWSVGVLGIKLIMPIYFTVS
jgi:hypothetical protein